MNTTKARISLMYCRIASGMLLSLHVVYKAEHLWESWCNGGLKVQDSIEQNLDGSMLTVFKTGFLARPYPTSKNWMGRKSS